MAIWDAVLERLGYVKAAQAEAPHLSSMAHAASPYIDQRVMWANQADAYKQSSWLYKAISTMARAAALVPLHVYRVTGDGSREAIDNHPFETVLRRPNPFYSRFEFMVATFSPLAINGNAFWYVRPNLAGTAGELWPLRPDRMKVVPDKDNFIKGYVHEVDGQPTPFEVDEVCHFRFYHPLDDYVGMSPEQPLALALGNDTAAQEWNYTFFKNQAMPDMVMSTDQTVSPQDFERITRWWDTRFKGRSKGHKTGFLPRGFKPQPIGRSQRDMDFIESRKLSREEIWQVLNTPLGMWTENATEANAKVALQVFYNFGLWPILCAVHDKMTAQILPMYGNDLVAEYEDVRITDRQLALEEEDVYSRSHTINEVRAKFHDDEPLEGGDVVLTGRRGQVPGVGEAETAITPLTPQPALPTKSREPEGLSEAELEAMRSEMAKWEKWALARMKDGRWPPDRPFETKHIDSIEGAYIRAALSAAQTPEEVKAAFAAPFCGYP